MHGCYTPTLFSRNQIDKIVKHSCFSDFVFKIRLIKLGFSFKKNKEFLYLNSQPTDSQSGAITIIPKSQLWVGDTENLQ